MLRAFAEIRRTGVGFARDELATGSASVAAPVFDAWGDVVAALAIECYSSRMNLRRLAPAVQTAAIGASRQLQAHRHTGRRSLDRVRELSQ
jgi:IclR family acetate operon transcriptional repressor